MKISDAIRQLEEIQKERGDIDVLAWPKKMKALDIWSGLSEDWESLAEPTIECRVRKPIERQTHVSVVVIES